MKSLDEQLDDIESAMHAFFMSIKQPAYWSKIAKLADTNIDRPAAAIIQRIAFSAAGYCHVQELASNLHVESPTITRKTQELELAGLLERTHDSKDKRVVILKLTSEGKKTADRIHNAQRSILAQSLDIWNKDDSLKFSELFADFAENFSKIAKS
jgi:DNA-binding MarR family transcriptional regulator